MGGPVSAPRPTPERLPPRRVNTAFAVRSRRSPVVTRRSRLRRAVWLKASMRIEKPIAA